MKENCIWLSINSITWCKPQLISIKWCLVIFSHRLITNKSIDDRVKRCQLCSTGLACRYCEQTRHRHCYRFIHGIAAHNHGYFSQPFKPGDFRLIEVLGSCDSTYLTEICTLTDIRRGLKLTTWMTYLKMSHQQCSQYLYTDLSIVHIYAVCRSNLHSKSSMALPPKKSFLHATLVNTKVTPRCPLTMDHIGVLAIQRNSPYDNWVTLTQLIQTKNEFEGLTLWGIFVNHMPRKTDQCILINAAGHNLIKFMKENSESDNFHSFLGPGTCIPLKTDPSLWHNPIKRRFSLWTNLRLKYAFLHIGGGRGLWVSTNVTG